MDHTEEQAMRLRHEKDVAFFMNARWSISIKQDLVPTDSIFMFADPKFVGKNFIHEDRINENP
jgi:hypothetical protein